MRQKSGKILVLSALAVMTISFTHQVVAQDNVSAAKRVERVEKQLRALQRKVFGANGLPAGTEVDQPAGQVTSSRKLMADLSVKISSVERQMREITGRLEAIEHRQELLQNKIDFLTKDTSIRFEEMRTSAETSRPATTGPDSVATAAKAPEMVLPEGKAAAQFEWAFSYIAKNDLKNGRKALMLFLKKYPQGDLSANAHFWLGGVNLQELKYNQAAKHYLIVFEDYPKHKKAPEALVKLGGAMIQLGENESACEAYLEFRRAYPDADARLKRRVDADEKKAQC